MGLCLSVLTVIPAFAQWQYEVYGPGSAVWINTETQERVEVFPGAPAPDGTEAKAEGEAAGDELPLLENEDTTAAAGTEQAETASSAVDESLESQGAVDEVEQTAGVTAEPGQEGEQDINPNLVMSNGRQLDLTKPMVALTYDDGPYPAVGNLLMDELAKVNGRATFFMVGSRVAANQSEVQRMVQEGHEVANHSWDHQYFNKLGADAIKSQVSRTNDAIQAACGVRPVLLRLPGGNITQTVRENVNMPMIYWSIDTLDWKTRDAQKTIDAVVGKVKDGDIVLMHEIWGQTGVASQTIIPTLVNQGYQLVTVSELAKFKGHTLGLGIQYSSFR